MDDLADLFWREEMTEAQTFKIVRILCERDGLDFNEAKQLFRDGMADVRQAFEDGRDPGEVFTDWFGLEEDYLMALI
jgi:hypothetical protein